MVKEKKIDYLCYKKLHNDMTYTVTINDKSEKARSIVKMLKELSKDYPFLKVYEEGSGLSEELEKELEKRLAYVIRNPEIGKTWVEVKNSLPK